MKKDEEKNVVEQKKSHKKGQLHTEEKNENVAVTPSTKTVQKKNADEPEKMKDVPIESKDKVKKDAAKKRSTLKHKSPSIKHTEKEAAATTKKGRSAVIDEHRKSDKKESTDDQLAPAKPEASKKKSIADVGAKSSKESLSRSTCPSSNTIASKPTSSTSTHGQMETDENTQH